MSDAMHAAAPEGGGGSAPAPAPVEGEVVLPSSFDGYVALAKKVSKGAMTDKAMIWVGLAQADALNRLADGLDELLGFLNPSKAADGEDQPSALAAAIADGIFMAGPETEEKSKKNGK